MCRFLILFVASFLFISCAEQVKMEDRYVLQPVDNYLEYAIDDETVVPLYNLYIFKDNGEDFLTFSNPLARTILIYNLHSGELVKKLSFEREGPNGVGGHIFGYYIKDFNHIFLPSAITTQIYLTDTTGVLKQKIDFSKTEEGLKPNKAYYENISFSQLAFMGNSLYIPQTLNNKLGEKMIEESPIGILVDTITGKVTGFPMHYPHVIPYRNRLEVIGGMMEACQIYNGKNLIIAFNKDEKVYIVDELGQAKSFQAKSKYLSELKFPKAPDDFSLKLKKTNETGEYRNIFYDKYRKVYYRFVALETELDPNENFQKLLHSGRADFSIMILDENFNVLGETKFPPFTYVPHICFINEDGLYLSTSHFKREDYSDDWLRFQRIELVKK